MAAQIEGRSRELLEGKNFCGVVTIGEDGRPDVVVVWVDTDGQDVLLNSAEGRAWPESLRRDPRVTLAVANHENPYEYVAIDGDVAEITPEGADEHIDKLAKKYLDKDEYPFRQPGEVRLLIRVRPSKVSVRGG
jgi:PPOX class probable F420-dependent enzyme